MRPDIAEMSPMLRLAVGLQPWKSVVFAQRSLPKASRAENTTGLAVTMRGLFRPFGGSMNYTAAAASITRTEAPAKFQIALFALFAVSGFCGLIYESIWAYYLKLFVGHAAYAQTVVLVVFIGGMAIGAWLARHFAERTRNPPLSYAMVECIVGMFAIAFQWTFSTTT